MCVQIRQICLSVLTPIRRACLLALLLAAPLATCAEEFPSRAIKLVAPFPAGGPGDTFGRVLADKMGALLGNSAVIENRALAGGLTGTASVAKADPDGHTIAASSALAIGAKTRSPSLPDVATTAVLGMRQVEADNWYGLVVAAATPAPIAQKLRAVAVEALHAAEVKDKYLSQGAIAVGNSSEEFTAYVKAETERWGRVIATAGIKLK